MAIFQSEYIQPMVAGYPGELANLVDYDIVAYANAGLQTFQQAVISVPVGSNTASVAYNLTFVAANGNSGSASITGQTSTSLVTTLTTALNSNPNIYGWAIAAASGSIAVTLTARAPGTAGSFSVTASGAYSGSFTTSGTATPAADSVPLPYGIVVSQVTGTRSLVPGGNTEVVSGISLRTQADRSASGTVSTTLANRPVNVLRGGYVFISPATVINSTNDIVRYVAQSGTAVGSIGQITTQTTAAGTAILNGAKFETTAVASGIAVLRYNKGGIA
jgi:hypothetical protein